MDRGIKRQARNGIHKLSMPKHYHNVDLLNPAGQLSVLGKSMYTLGTGPKVIFSCSTQLSMKFQLV